jgi:hypothetical protein
MGTSISETVSSIFMMDERKDCYTLKMEISDPNINTCVPNYIVSKPPYLFF